MRLQSSVSISLLFTVLVSYQHDHYANGQTILRYALQRHTCNYDIIPSAPRNLVVRPKGEAVIVKWWGPINKPCEVTYEVAVFGAGNIASVEVKGTTATLTGLRDDITYDVTVTARTQKGRGPSIKASTSPFGGSSHLNSASSLINGHFALVPATGRDWKCSPEPSISICPAAAARLCNPMTCADVAKRGLCDTPFMRQTDWQKKMVTQFCSDECRCAATPTLRQTLAGPAPDACCDIQTAEYFIDEYGRSTNDIHR